VQARIIDADIKKSATLSVRLTPHFKDAIIMAAHEQGISVSDYITKACARLMAEEGKSEEIKQLGEEVYKDMRRAIRRMRPVRRMETRISHKLALIKRIREIEKQAPPPQIARNLYEDMLTQVAGDDELTSIVKEMFRQTFNISPPLMNKGTLVVYEDFIRIDTCGCYPVIHRDVEALIPKLNERGSILLTNFPFRFYRLIADAQREIWKLCGKEQTI